MKRFVLFGVGAALGLLCSTRHAQAPQLNEDQGRGGVSTTNFSGAGTTIYWNNDGTSNNGSAPMNPVSIRVTNELYSVFRERTKKTS